MATKVHLNPSTERPFKLAKTNLEKRLDIYVGSFQSMATPCEVLMDTDDGELAQSLLDMTAEEAWRVEQKFSRYITGNIIHQINTCQGRPVKVDEETARLLDYAEHCTQLSEGLFDITSGILRKAWKFDGSGHLASQETIEKLLPLVGWSKVTWNNPYFSLQPGMEIDLGGIAKEYAVDRVVQLITENTDTGVLVNFGGDIAISGIRRRGKPWAVGIENNNKANQATNLIHMTKGAITTSGDSKKFLIVQGKRYGHILDPRTGWPVEDAPRSVTVAGRNCSEAGFLSTCGILNGINADSFLKQTGLPYWIN
jgi:thiamine biosynthesis lipoprotein